jgi:hypothetical protein
MTYTEKITDLVNEHFPKLNSEDTSKPSPNNRSAALVFQAEVKMILKEIHDEIEVILIKETEYGIPHQKTVKRLLAILEKIK